MERFSEFQERNELHALLAHVLKEEAVAAETIYDYYNQLLDRYQPHPFVGDGLQRLAAFMDPVDRTLGHDEAVPVARALYMGMIIGARVVELQGTDALVDRLAEASLPRGIFAEPEIDDAHKRHLQTELFVDVADTAYSQAPEFHDLLETWGDLLVHDVAMQPHFRRGFGLLLHMKAGAQKLQDEAQLLDGISDYDWDAAFIEAFRDGA